VVDDLLGGHVHVAVDPFGQDLDHSTHKRPGDQDGIHNEANIVTGDRQRLLGGEIGQGVPHLPTQQLEAIADADHFQGESPTRPPGTRACACCRATSPT
jgi:hypothetical protein